MAYTVKQLAEMSGVSVRSLHWYDIKGILKPAYHGVNGYRYYEKEQLLVLENILFFKELGFSLKSIQELLLKDELSMLQALQKRQRSLIDDIVIKKDLIIMIDKLISDFIKNNMTDDIKLDVMITEHNKLHKKIFNLIKDIK